MNDSSIITADCQRTNYLMPFVTMVFLFLIVGFLTTANTQFQMPLQQLLLSEMKGLKNSCATLITFSWFLAYPVCGSIGSRWVDRYGYRTTLVRGLMLMITGLALTLLCSLASEFLPGFTISAAGYSVPGAFIIFLLGSFVLGSSATVLQVVINPYLTACAVRGTQPVQRLAIGGSANSIGTTAAPFFVTAIVFSGRPIDAITVGQLNIPFLALMAIIAMLAFSLSRISLPDIQNTRSADCEAIDRSVWSFRHLALGVVAIFFYVGAEVCIGANINMYASERGVSSPALLATVYWGGMLIGRLAGSSLSKISPRTQLTVTTICATLLTAMAIVAENPWLLAGVGLFHSIMWGCIFTLAVAGLGKYTAAASGVFMTGVVGGAVLPLLQGMIADIIESWQPTWILVILCELFMLYYARLGSRQSNNKTS